MRPRRQWCQREPESSLEHVVIVTCLRNWRNCCYTLWILANLSKLEIGRISMNHQSQWHCKEPHKFCFSSFKSWSASTVQTDTSTSCCFRLVPFLPQVIIQMACLSNLDTYRNRWLPITLERGSHYRVNSLMQPISLRCLALVWMHLALNIAFMNEAMDQARKLQS